MRGDEAKQVCPEIQLIQVPVARGKADLNTYRDAGSQVYKIQCNVRDWIKAFFIIFFYIAVIVAMIDRLMIGISGCYRSLSEGSLRKSFD